MLNMFFGYISERSFLMAEFPMDDWRNNFDHFVNDKISNETLPRDVVIDEGNKDHPNVNPIDDIDHVNPVFSDTGHSGGDPDVQPCSNIVISDSPSLSNDKVNEDRVDKSTNCTLNDEDATHTTDENESARLVDVITANDLTKGLDNQLIDTPSLGDAHPSWDCLVFQTSPSRPGRKTKLRVTAEEKAKFNTLVFSSFLGVERENASLISSTSKPNDNELVVGGKNRIFYGLTIFFRGN
jgi:hypothetical protein